MAELSITPVRPHHGLHDIREYEYKLNVAMLFTALFIGEISVEDYATEVCTLASEFGYRAGA